MLKTRMLPNGRSVKVRDNDGLKKRCRCPPRQWSKCAHPWHFSFASDGTQYRWSLHKVADKPAGYWMSKSEAEGIRDRLRVQIREGNLADTAIADIWTGAAMATFRSGVNNRENMNPDCRACTHCRHRSLTRREVNDYSTKETYITGLTRLPDIA